MKSESKVQYSIQFSGRRKTILLKITDIGELKVYAPKGTKTEKIESVLSSHKVWIEKKMREIEHLPSQLPAHSYKEGDFFIFHDTPFQLQLVKSDASNVYKRGSYLVVESPSLSKVAVKKLIEGFYDTYGLDLFNHLVEKWIKKLNIEHIDYTVEMVNYPKRLGSCSAKQVLSFSRRSLMLPLDMLDYLALHEVAHLVYFNHGAAFKQLLKTHMSDYKERYEKIKQLRFRIAHL